MTLTSNVFQGHEASLIKLAGSYFDEQADVEDAMQDLFIKMMDTPMPDDDLHRTPFIMRMAINLFKNKLRREASRARLDSWSAEMDSLINYDDPASLTEYEQAVTMFSEQFATLPKDMQEFLQARYVEMLSYEDIAKKYGVAVGTVSSKLNRARQQCGITEAL